MWDRDFSYVTKGIKVDKKTGETSEYAFLGEVSYNKQMNKFMMAKPQMLIGTSRMELYEHLARRREVLDGLNKNWFKLALGATIAHALII